MNDVSELLADLPRRHVTPDDGVGLHLDEQPACSYPPEAGSDRPPPQVITTDQTNVLLRTWLPQVAQREHGEKRGRSAPLSPRQPDGQSRVPTGSSAPTLQAVRRSGGDADSAAFLKSLLSSL